MMKPSSNMFWSDVNDVKRFTENKTENKKKDTKKNSGNYIS